MIEVTRLNGRSYTLNSDLIKCIEPTPDTVITLTTGEKLMVLEKVDEIVERVIEFRRRLYAPVANPPGETSWTSPR